MRRAMRSIRLATAPMTPGWPLWMPFTVRRRVSKIHGDWSVNPEMTLGPSRKRISPDNGDGGLTALLAAH
jgi:hypothetical protein